MTATISELEVVRTLWPILAFIVANGIAFTVWILKQASAIKAERQARMVADLRIEEKIQSNNEHHKEKSDAMARSLEDLKKTQAEMLTTLQNVELGVTAIREYRKGQEDAQRRKR